MTQATDAPPKGQSLSVPSRRESRAGFRGGPASPQAAGTLAQRSSAAAS